MAGRPMEHAGTVMATLKVAGIDLTAFGEIDTDGLHPAHILIDSEKGIYRKLVHDQHQILGGIFLGDPGRRSGDEGHGEERQAAGT